MAVRNLLLIAVLLGLVSIGCAGAPTQADGTVTVTKTTSTTTTTVIPQLTAGTIGASPAGTGLASATLYTFLFVTPPSGGVPPYTVSWDLGDGGAGAGSTASHLYPNTGSFTTTATVMDSKGVSAKASLPVSIHSVTGRWSLTFDGGAHGPQAIDLVQNQAAVIAAINSAGDGLGSGAGSVSNPRSLSVSVTFAPATPGAYAATYAGTVSDTLLMWTGTVVGYSGCPCTFTATRTGFVDSVSLRSLPSSGRR
jgi:PKD domain-containing protein